MRPARRAVGDPQRRGVGQVVPDEERMAARDDELARVQRAGDEIADELRRQHHARLKRFERLRRGAATMREGRVSAKRSSDALTQHGLPRLRKCSPGRSEDNSREASTSKRIYLGVPRERISAVTTAGVLED